jgi:hypothetical protein
MKIALVLSSMAVSFAVGAADCSHKLPVSGGVGVPRCDPARQHCLPAHEAFNAYLQKAADDRSTFYLMAHASPWRFYDGDLRIRSVEEMAELIRGPLAEQGAKRVVIRASWSGVRPEPEVQSLAERLAASLTGVKVEGADGFLWIGKDGQWRTTHQAFTASSGGRYEVAEGDDVMVSLIVGWLAGHAGEFVAQRNARAVTAAGAAWDIFGLCPRQAYQLFETAAQMGDALGAYNAASILLEKGGEADIAAARAFLTQASGAGDALATARLQKLPR